MSDEKGVIRRRSNKARANEGTTKVVVITLKARGLRKGGDRR